MSAPTVESVTYRPAAPLRPYLDRALGYRMEGFAPGIHLGMPGASLTVIITFDEPLQLTMRPDLDHPPNHHHAILSGLHDRAVAIHHNGFQHGIQLDCTPAGARALFGVPPSELASLAVELDDLWPTAVATEFRERCEAAPSWTDRFAELERVLLASLHRHENRTLGVHAAAAQAWQALTATDGRVAVNQLANELGWSRRHLGDRFHAEFGLSPKTMGRILRFNRSMTMLRTDPHRNLADVAAACGYADHAHMTRDWRSVCDTTPTRWLADEVFPFVQDLAPA